MQVIVVDQSEEVRGVLRRVILESGHIVIGEARNGSDAIKLCERRRPGVVFLDKTLDDMEVTEALRSIREISRETMVVITSTGGDPDSFESDMLGVGAAAFLSKPFGARRVESLLKTLSAED